MGVPDTIQRSSFELCKKRALHRVMPRVVFFPVDVSRAPALAVKVFKAMLQSWTGHERVIVVA